MPHNYTVWDIAATIIAFGLFGLFIVIPGYVLGALLDVFAFGRRTLPARLAISVSLSVAVVPIATYLCWLSVPSVPWLLCAASWAVLPVLLVRTRQRGPGGRPLSKQRTILLAVVGGWVVIGTLCLVDLQIGHRLYFPVTSYDYALRAAFTAAIERTGVPPFNPYFYPGHGYTMRYHYFWYMLCSLVVRFGRPFVSARIAVIAGTLWVGIGLVAIVTLYVHLFRSRRPANPDRQMLTAVALLSVTGLDILPLTITFLLTGKFNASSEWWNEPVLSWVNSVFWQPHSIAALVACTTGLLAIRDASGRAEWRFRLSGAAIGGAAFASGVGLSIYVTFVFAAFLIVWVVTLLFRGRRFESVLTCMAGAFAMAISVPYLLELMKRGSGGGGSGGMPIAFAIRPFYLAEALVNPSGAAPWWQISLADLLTLPINYYLEFGFFFVVGVRQWNRIRRRESASDVDACGIAILGTSILISSFLRSSLISFNDLGWRGIILAQFILLIWGAELWDKGLFLGRKTVFSGVGALLALGLAATVYDVTMLRIYPVLLDDMTIPRYHWLAPDHHLGERTYALREVYEKLSGELPRDAIVQQNPNAVPEDLFYGSYADRQAAAETSSCGVVFGGSAALCEGIVKPIDELFDGSGPQDFSKVDLVCRQLAISALVVKDTDSVWQDNASWVWKREPLIGNSYARAFLCGAGKEGPGKPVAQFSQ